MQTNLLYSGINRAGARPSRACARLALAALIVGLSLAPAALAARTVYVSSGAAKLLAEPRMNADGPALAKGASLEVIGEQGLFLRVRSNAGSGWTPRIFVSPYPVASSAVDVQQVEKKSGSNVRARASHYSETAAARGMRESETGVRTRGEASDYNFAAVEWIESVSDDVTEEQAADFAQSGGLNP